MFEQSGEFCPETLKFYPDPNNNTAGSHMVQFDSVKEFEKYRTDKK